MNIMEFYISHPYVIIFVSIAIIVIIAILSRPIFIGRRGEKRVAKYLSSLDKDTYKVLHDVMLKTNTGYTQIDHIVISVYGIFVIETKNYSGWIIGKERADKWIKNVYGKKYYFRNPIIQNYGHIKALEMILHVSKEHFFSIVTFSNRATIKVKTKQIPVIYYNKITKYIKNHTNILLDKEEVSRLYNEIITLNIKDRKIAKEHVRNIQRNVANKEALISHHICPKCGGKLLERKGKQGAFIGCSNYPKCRFTTNK